MMNKCCLTNHVFKMSKRYHANVALEINVKIGARITNVCDVPTNTIIFSAPTSGKIQAHLLQLPPSRTHPRLFKEWQDPNRGKMTGGMRLFKEWQDPNRGKMSGGMIKYARLSILVGQTF